jgi:glycosidase
MCNDPVWGHADRGGLVHLEADDCVADGFSGMNASINLATDPGLSFTHDEGEPAYVSIANDRLSVRFRARRDLVESARLAIGGDTLDMHVQFSSGLNDFWRVSSAATTGEYTILLETTDGPETFGPYDAPTDPFRSVSWASDAVAYQIFPERFWNGDPSNDSLTLSTDEFHYNDLWESNGPTLASSWTAAPHPSQHCCHQYFGGDIQGILDRVQHLVDLGVTVVYLNPIWHSGSAHGYDAFDYTMLAPEYGDSALLRTFVDEMTAAGIHLIWDFVPNHVGLGFWAFQDAVQNGESSPYWDWFRFHPDGDNGGGIQTGDEGDYDTWCFGTSCFGSLPKLRVGNPEVFDYLVDVAAAWTDYGFDGIRIDVPLDVENGSSFFPAMRAAVKAIDPDAYIVGEIWERNPAWLEGDRFDALMNYAIGRDVVARFGAGQLSGAGAWGAMVELYASYPEAATAMLFNVIATHDTGRLLTQLGGGELNQTPSATALSRQRMVAALLYALPGMPVTYYGDECAMLGTNDGSIHRSRRTMDWDRCTMDAYGMVEHYARLAELKSGPEALEALGTGVIREHVATASVLSFLRGEPGPGEVLAVFNQSNGTQTVALPAGTWLNAADATSVGATGSVEVGSYGWLYLVRSEL